MLSAFLPKKDVFAQRASLLRLSVGGSRETIMAKMALIPAGIGAILAIIPN